MNTAKGRPFRHRGGALQNPGCAAVVHAPKGRKRWLYEGVVFAAFVPPRPTSLKGPSPLAAAMSLADDLLPHMRRVLAADRDLHDLSLLWQMIEAASAISCPEDAETILPTLSQTRSSFVDLQQRLVRQLAHEHVAELGDELASIAQCTIDILVRNLFERTADVGFLATDDALRAFCGLPPDARAAELPALRRRLAEYRDKYTVYDDIVLLGTDGTVLARLDDRIALAASTDPIVAAALGRAGYVERHAVTDLSADGHAALLYGHRVNDGHGHALGVLVLRFRCADEMQRIFASVVDQRHHVSVALVDEHARVLVSSDESHVPLGTRIATGADGQCAITLFAGREYLSVTCAARGYQGYAGPGWRAQAMVSLLTAFRGVHEADEQQTVSLDNEPLRRIQSDVDEINRNLRRVVWNGRLMAGLRTGSQAQLKAVLQQVAAAGTRTRDRVAVAIGDLYGTALGRARHQARELARLAADIMDRNLYERANDCRWWALSPVLQRLLAAPLDAAGRRELSAVLAHVNSLYTVYTRLVVFDGDGCIVGASNDDPAAPLIGRQADAAVVRATLALGDSQRYAVSEFAPTMLSAGVPTYVYSAAVRPAAGARPVGGIAIVFDGAREFRAMLVDVLGDRAGIAAFIDAQGRVLASSDDRQPVGQALPFDATQGIVEHDGAHHAVACTPAVGYREFKHDDGHRNGVRAVVALRLGKLERRRTSLHDQVPRAHPPADRARTRELAVFNVASGRYALALQHVIEARPMRGLVRTPGSHGAFLGLMEVSGDGQPVVVPVLCMRRLAGIDTAPRAHDGVVLVLPGQAGSRRPALGLRVDDVSTVLELGLEHLQAVPTAGARAGLVTALARLPDGAHGAGRLLVQLIGFQALLRVAGVAADAMDQSLGEAGWADAAG